ncbi:heavy metal translocating P-type ATPase [Thauera sp.]|uniref:heavy metal translocating P-type ATPase n=1 Tax=Thauera sp. TaxID=1905334 RepID=UPI001B3D156C|nr:heavy metal translocating P-type ATPase [Thauera sp.]MBP6107490.1 cadmium-translocating P-type ATPase [Steroidobacteraceae bacterium]MBP6130510.1 cadmium-translocating P-type ATPase [Thauera sp.]
MNKVTEDTQLCNVGGACAQDATPSQELLPGAAAENTVYRIPAMDCATEEMEIRQALSSVVGVRRLGFALGTRTLMITAGAAGQQQAQDAIRAAGFEINLVDAGQSGQTLQAESADDDRRIGAGLARLMGALILAVGAEALAYLAPATLLVKVVGMALAAAAIGLSGLSVYKKGLVALSRARLNINALMSVAVTGAFVIGQWPEAAMVMALYAIAELIEARAVDQARNAITSLMALAPDEAEVRQADGSWVRVAAASVHLEAIIRVKPGERVPLDGVVTVGNSAINQAPVTGESIPVDKQPGDLVFAGTINETGLLECRVTAVASNTTLARIIHAVEEAQSTRAPTQRFVDRFAAIYTPAIFVIALAVAIVGPLGFGWPWLDALYKALVLLVIACPCALVISTPVTVVSGLTAAARRGILIKGGTYLEDARKIKAIALDKTGTVTEGKPRLVAFDAIAADHTEQRTGSLAASLAAHSDHPVSKAIAAGLDHPLEAVDEFNALAGRGVQGRVGDDVHALGNHRLIEDRGQCSAELEARLAEHESQGRTVTLLASSTKVLGLFAVADTIKASSRTAIAELRALGVTPVMLTGDNEATARSIAAQAGIEDARGNLLPEDKLAAIRDLQRQYGPTAMTGDGINDAPALAQADMGIAMGAAGTDTAMEAADIVIMNDDLRRIPETIRLSRRTHSVLWQNITLALGIKSVFLVLALLGSATMWMAVFADMGASLLVVFNGMRLLRATERAG